MEDYIRRIYVSSLIGIICIILLLIVYSSTKTVGDIENKETETKADIKAINEIIKSKKEKENTTNTPKKMNEVEKIKMEGEFKSIYDTVEEEIELLKSKDTTTIIRYFGEGEQFKPEIVADRVSAVKITFINNSGKINNSIDKELRSLLEVPSKWNMKMREYIYGKSIRNYKDKNEVIVHICTLNYNKIKEDTIELKNKHKEESEIKEKIAEGILDGLYDIHYNIPIKMVRNKIEVTEEWKQAITGGWYRGVNVDLEGVECILE